MTLRIKKWCSRCRKFKDPLLDNGKILCPDCNRKMRMRARSSGAVKREFPRY